MKRVQTQGSKPLLAHAAAYLVLLLALLAVTDLRSGWNFDDGAYATQVKVIEQTGAWAYPYRHADVDPTWAFAPVSHSTMTDQGTFPYVKQPAWVEVLRVSTAVFGEPVGFYLPSVLGAVLAALMAGMLASRLSPQAGPLGFWAVALGPLVVHTEALWAHTAAAALGGAAAWLVVELASDRNRRWHPAALVAVVATLCALRGEGAIFAVAVAGTVGVLMMNRPGPLRQRVTRAASWGGPVLLAAAAVRLLDARWASRVAPGRALPVGNVDTILADLGFVEARVRGATRTLLDGLGGAPSGTMLAAVAVVLAVIGGVLLARSGARARDGGLLVVVAVALVVVRTVLVAPDDMGGLLVAVPLVAAGAGAWRWRSAAGPERALVVLIGVHLAGVLVTQYPEGGSRDWGGRFLFPVLVPLVVLAVVTLRPLVPAGAKWGRPLALVALLALSAAPTAAGLRAATVARSSNRELTELSLSVDAPTVIRIPRYLTRTSWRALPGRDWLSAEIATAPRALALLRPGRTEPIAVVGAGADLVRAPGYRRDVRSSAVVIFTPV